MGCVNDDLATHRGRRVDGAPPHLMEIEHVNPTTQQLIQAVILASGAASVWMTQSRRRRWRRWASAVGIVGQPWWLTSTWSTGHWGMFGVSVAITCAWLVGLRRLLARAGTGRTGKIGGSISLPAKPSEESATQ